MCSLAVHRSWLPRLSSPPILSSNFSPSCTTPPTCPFLSFIRLSGTTLCPALKLPSNYPTMLFTLSRRPWTLSSLSLTSWISSVRFLFVI